MNYSESVNNLILQLGKFPGIGSKTAVRLAFYILETSKENVEEMTKAMLEAKDKVTTCPICFNLAEGDNCTICNNSKRDNTTICVVENVKDVVAMEKTNGYNGLYHVLHGAISPLNNITPADIKVKELLERLKTDQVKEIILATNPTIEGEATAMYIARIINPLGVKTTRIAHGIPVGGDLEYADEITISMAMENRREI